MDRIELVEAPRDARTEEKGRSRPVGLLDRMAMRIDLRRLLRTHGARAHRIDDGWTRERFESPRRDFPAPMG